MPKFETTIVFVFEADDEDAAAQAVQDAWDEFSLDIERCERLETTPVEA